MASPLHRTLLSTAGGALELLTAAPLSGLAPTSRPLLFIPGGFHSAACFRLLLPHLHKRNIPAYSLSLRSHGQSYRSPLWKELLWHPRDLQHDVLCALKFIAEETGGKVAPILAGHSAGGGLCQYVLQNEARKGRYPAHGLLLMATFPAFGGLQVFVNWAKLDKELFSRSVKMFGHPKAPLATPELVRAAFFSSKYPPAGSTEMDQVFKELEDVESVVWPAAFINRIVNESEVLGAVGGRVCVLGGREDKLMTPDIVRDTARGYGVLEVIFEDSGHDLMLDRNWRAVGDRIAETVGAWK